MTKVTAKIGEPRAVHVHDIDLQIPIPVRIEGDLAAVRRPGRTRILGPILGQVKQSFSLPAHDVDVRETIAVRSEGQPLAIRRPSGSKIHGRIIREPPTRPGGRISHVDFPIAVLIRFEGDQGPAGWRNAASSGSIRLTQRERSGDDTHQGQNHDEPNCSGPQLYSVSRTGRGGSAALICHILRHPRSARGRRQGLHELACAGVAPAGRFLQSSQNHSLHRRG